MGLSLLACLALFGVSAPPEASDRAKALATTVKDKAQHVSAYLDSLLWSSDGLFDAEVGRRRPDYFKGSWRYDPTVEPNQDEHCMVSPVEGETEDEHRQRAIARSNEVARWVWDPEPLPSVDHSPAGSSATGWRKWDALELMDRLLRSEMGLFLIGGASLASGHQSL